MPTALINLITTRCGMFQIQAQQAEEISHDVIKCSFHSQRFSKIQQALRLNFLCITSNWDSKSLNETLKNSLLKLGIQKHLPIADVVAVELDREMNILLNCTFKRNYAHSTNVVELNVIARSHNCKYTYPTVGAATKLTSGGVSVPTTKTIPSESASGTASPLTKRMRIRNFASSSTNNTSNKCHQQQ
ncbi:hypothetical protein T4A_947 [Trichinella pseudospiralis]|uniref:Uncharacterized protein n=1 Tax=Trichinella pseudospiralis TaxID=6337 RepID=A0A0V1EGX4_TRIPS|nr:hypothetical protein T4A_947 [Trichinella pseudospiralis]